MFRRKGRLGSDTSNAPQAFDDKFWHWYADSYGRNLFKEVDHLLKPNPKKYTASSASVTTIIKYFENLKLTIPCNNQVIALLKSPFTQGDIVKTFHLIRFYQLSSEGLFITNEGFDKLGGVINYVGAENLENVMCYLDALLFSMFANLESFEPMLFISNQNMNYLTNQLSTLLRLYVNCLRSGNLITTDLTMRICETLTKLGFDEAMSHRQQDSATLFEFITQTLSMPLLTFKIDIKHAGKLDKDDHKYSKERILFVSLPEEEEESTIPVEKPQENHMEDRAHGIESKTADTNDHEQESLQKPPQDTGTEHGFDHEHKETLEGTSEQKIEREADEEHKNEAESEPEQEGILLEECLEHYFNNSISVKRELERRATLESLRRDSMGNGNLGEANFNNIPEHPNPSSDLKHETTSEQIEFLEDQANLSENPTQSQTRQSRSGSKSISIRGQTRTRSSTLSLWSSNDNNNPEKNKTKEVSLPAWMFLRLLPFYTDDNEIDHTNESVAKSSTEFVSRRPILPICLKRYSFNPQKSQANRSKKKIIIPPIINLPQFVADDVNDNTTGDYKLILESVVCHRGTSISSGHYISIIRKNTNVINETEEEAYNATWLLYDDMHRKSRVVEKSFKEAFETEWPYMLFYRLVPNSEFTGPSATGSSTSSIINMKHSASSSTSSLAIPPKGSKTKYWTEKPDETLSTIISISNSNPASLKLGDIHSLNLSDSVLSTTSSIPIPDITPTDPKFIDIRDKYYWYVTDKNKNYHKESPDLKLNSSSNPNLISSLTSNSNSHSLSNSNTVCTTRFRRNSQWSEKSSNFNLNQIIFNDKVGIDDIDMKDKLSQTPDPADINDKLEKLDLSQSNSLNSKWKSFKLRSKSEVSSPYLQSPGKNISTTSLENKMSPISISGEVEPISPISHKSSKKYHIFGHENAADNSHKNRSSSSNVKHHKKIHKKREDYKKEKCIIM